MANAPARWPTRRGWRDPEPRYTVQVLTPADAPRPFCAGLLIADGVCVGAAPILRYCIGASAAWIKGHLIAKGWQAVIIAEPSPQAGQFDLTLE